MAVVDELAGAVAAVAASGGPSIVGLGPGWGLGSGVVVASGQVLTNAHNVPAAEVEVRFADGRKTVGTVSARDEDSDLAVVAVETGEAPPALRWADDVTVDIGTPVVALANPGGRGLRATFGFVSATDRAFRGPRGRRIRGAVEHTAPMARGSSGGPLMGLDGRLLGVNTHRLGEGFYLAQPAGPTLRAHVEALARGDVRRRPRLGVALAPEGAARRLRAAVGLAEHDGALVHAVEDGSPAAQAGLRRGDLVVAAADREIRRNDDLLDALEAAADTLSLTVLRGAERNDVTVRLTPAEP